jgi:hypothetical protein
MRQFDAHVDQSAQTIAVLPAIQVGALTIYQLYDIGDSIDLDHAQNCLATPTARRQPPLRVRQSESIQIAQPPVWVDLRTISTELGGISSVGALRASIYDLGVVALALTLPLPRATSWESVAEIMAATQSLPATLQQQLLAALDELEALIRAAISQPERTQLVEDYSVLRVEQLTEPTDITMLAEHPLVLAALLGERRPLSPEATGLIRRTSYFPDDVALLSWNGALLIEADPLAAATAADLIEFANVELLLMRSYDAELEAEQPLMYRRIEAAQSPLALPLARRYSRLLQTVQSRIIEVTEVAERVDNAFKVTDDVYWYRFYSTALDVLRVHIWRADVEHRLALLRETYTMLQDQAGAERAVALEWTIILLIAFEIVMALLGL